jgi:DNA-binding response OmpR family regulator
MDHTEHPTIMVVDDDEDLLQAMSFLLERYGFRVDARLTPPNWIELQAVHPALLFLDVELSPQNGMYICKSIKENLADWKLPVVLTSAHPEEQLEQEARFCHADAILPKPFGSGAMKRLAEHFAFGGEQDPSAC